LKNTRDLEVLEGGRQRPLTLILWSDTPVDCMTHLKMYHTECADKAVDVREMITTAQYAKTSDVTQLMDGEY
jgi:hypothetical protein